jgi:hypothetical protein
LALLFDGGGGGGGGGGAGLALAESIASLPPTSIGHGSLLNNHRLLQPRADEQLRIP